MNRPDVRLLLGALAAVAVPATVLHFSAEDARLSQGLTAAPFAWPRVLVAHLATALPLGFFAARALRTIPDIAAMARAVWLVIGCAVTGVAVLVSPGLGESLINSDFGAVAGLMLRAALAFVLVLPWCIATVETPAAASRLSYPRMTLALVLGIATIPCGVYAEAVIAARTEQATELLGRERLAKAEPVLIGLCELGSERPVFNKPPGEIRKVLAANIAKLRKVAEYPVPASAPTPQKIGKAVLLIQLDRLDEAEVMLHPLAVTDDTAALLLASVYRDQQRWAESDAIYTGVFEKHLPRAATDAKATQMCFTALEGLAFNAREDRRPADVERVLLRGLEVLPAESAYFHFQLGRHYADGGRPQLAIEHLTLAAEQNPEKYSVPANKLIQSQRTSTPACVPWKSR